MSSETGTIPISGGLRQWRTPVVIEATVASQTEQFKGSPGPDITTEVGSAGS